MVRRKSRQSNAWIWIVAIIGVLIILSFVIKSNPIVNVPFLKIPHPYTMERMGEPLIQWKDNTDYAKYEHYWSKTSWFGGKATYRLLIFKTNTQITEKELFDESKGIVSKYLKKDIKNVFTQFKYPIIIETAGVPKTVNGIRYTFDKDAHSEYIFRIILEESYLVYVCPLSPTVNCMPVVYPEIQQEYCEPAYRQWAQENCNVQYLD